MWQNIKNCRKSGGCLALKCRTITAISWVAIIHKESNQRQSFQSERIQLFEEHMSFAHCKRHVFKRFEHLNILLALTPQLSARLCNSHLFSFLPFPPSSRLQVYSRKTGCCAGNDGVRLNNSELHQISPVTFAWSGERHLQHISWKGNQKHLDAYFISLCAIKLCYPEMVIKYLKI